MDVFLIEVLVYNRFLVSFSHLLSMIAKDKMRDFSIRPDSSMAFSHCPKAQSAYAKV